MKVFSPTCIMDCNIFTRACICCLLLVAKVLTIESVSVKPPSVRTLTPWCTGRDLDLKWLSPSEEVDDDKHAPTVDFYPVGGELGVSLNWSSWARDIADEDTSHAGYLIAIKIPAYGGYGRCSCFRVPTGVHSLHARSSATEADIRSISQKQRWLNGCLYPAYSTMVDVKRLVEIKSFGAVTKTTAVSFTIPSCASLDCRPKFCQQQKRYQICRLPLPVRNLRTELVNSTAVRVSWQHRKRPHVTALPAITGFTVHLQCVTCDVTESRTFTTSAGMTSLIVTELQVHHHYKVTVRAGIHPHPFSHKRHIDVFLRDRSPPPEVLTTVASTPAAFAVETVAMETVATETVVIET
eukprot:scpid33499/ scgid8280/ 